MGLSGNEISTDHRHVMDSATWLVAARLEQRLSGLGFVYEFLGPEAMNCNAMNTQHRERGIHGAKPWSSTYEATSTRSVLG